MSNLRTPLYQWHADHKARMVPFGGWEMPVQYAGIAPEHKAVRSGAGLFDISHMARVNFGGSGALAFLEKVFTNSVTTMKDGQVRYGLVCKDDGGILDDVLVYRWPYGFAAVINASNREKILAWLEQHRAGFEVEIQDQTLSTTMIAVQGPKSVELVQGMFADDVTTLKYYYAMPTRYKDKPCVVSRTGYTGEDGFEVIVPNALGVTLWEEFVAKGAVPCGLGARDTLRLEAAMPLYGHELNETIDPIHAGLAWAVKLDKGDFIGRDAIQQAAADTQKPVRVGLEIEGKRAAREGCVLTDADGTPVGTVTSGSLCPGLDKSLAMAYVDPQFASVGSALDVDLRGTKIPATVVPLPFYKRKK
ncbi:glycine cleavage system aminomethyltransferase GcvT [Gemmata sp. G18]|uniref:Aminomethyltransferase n=1 Tax=Gemmata palustris TaxID=2822762 RepID=A0ABS5C324_9BACT|nr:glycine cleavage system aminomethyltransferase GcvT [Gemmata palustris]MBP3960255.1 glycine cleavage system aminomethyltransferase GcvT [Gemmata palustris]